MGPDARDSAQARPDVLGNGCVDAELGMSRPPQDDSASVPVRASSSSSRLGAVQAGAAGFRGTTSSSINPEISRDELIEQGIPASQADAMVVRHREEEIFMQHFRCWICGFLLIVTLLTIAMFVILVWMIVNFFDNMGLECDVPLLRWVHIVILIVLFNSTCNRPSIHGSLVQRFLCQWVPDQNNPQPVPRRVRIWNLSCALFVFILNCLGVYWTSVDGSHGGGGPPCKEAAPGLYQSAQVYAYFNLAFTLFMYINMVGVNQLLHFAVRRGLLRTSEAAPEGSMDKNCAEVSANDPAISESPSCSICLEDFNDSMTILKTKSCNHLFHKQCLKGWLQVNRTCPLCRQDLGC